MKKQTHDYNQVTLSCDLHANSSHPVTSSPTLVYKIHQKQAPKAWLKPTEQLCHWTCRTLIMCTYHIKVKGERVHATTHRVLLHNKEIKTWSHGMRHLKDSFVTEVIHSVERSYYTQFRAWHFPFLTLLHSRGFNHLILSCESSNQKRLLCVQARTENKVHKLHSEKGKGNTSMY